jgi:ribonucleoside-diphosphate reductase beta chain
MYFKTKEVEKRYSLFPILYQDLWDFYNVNKKQPWLAEDVDLSKDKYDELLPNEQIYLKNILAFFTISDGLVIDNIATMFYNNVDIMEAQYFYGNQIAIEQIHAEAYSLLIDTYITDLKDKKDLFNSMDTNLAVSKKASWAKKWLDHQSLVHRLIAFACVEGLSFSSVFAGVFWFRSRNKMEGLGAMNELIIRDETSHYNFAVYLYNNYISDDFKLSSKDIQQIILECYEVEKVFVEESMPEGLSGLTKDMMIQYVQFVTDTILNDFGISKAFNVNNPLNYMARLGLLAKNNFFEQRSGQYTKVEIPTNNANIFDEDF